MSKHSPTGVAVSQKIAVSSTTVAVLTRTYDQKKR